MQHARVGRTRRVVRGEEDASDIVHDNTSAAPGTFVGLQNDFMRVQRGASAR
jgi:hypothetical protein